MNTNKAIESPNGHEIELAHIRKFSSVSYEEKLINVLALKMGCRDSAEAYRKMYLNSYDLTPNVTNEINTVTVNASEVCNFKCIMCDVPNNNRQSSESISKTQIISFLHDAAKSGAKCCMIGSGSEITLRSDWREILAEAIKLFPDTILFTNGSRLKDHDLELFVSQGLTRLFISLDAASRETFIKIRGYDLLDQIEEKIYRLIALRNKHNSTLPLVRTSFVVQSDNIHEEQIFKSKWIDIVDSVDFQKYVDIASFRDHNYANSLPEIDPSLMYSVPKCHYPFSYLSLWSNGKLSPCCTSYGRDCDELSLGNINEQNVIENAKIARIKLQEAFISKDWSHIPNCCRHCLKD